MIVYHRYQEMLRCWEQFPDERPDMEDMIDLIENKLEEIDPLYMSKIMPSHDLDHYNM